MIGGELDTVFSPAQQTSVAREYRNSQLQLVRGVGHTLHWEQPDKFVALLMNFAK